MIVRTATLDDLPAFEALWHELQAEVPPPAHEETDIAAELAEIRALVESGLGWAAERDGDVVGMVLGRRRGPRVGRHHRSLREARRTTPGGGRGAGPGRRRQIRRGRRGHGRSRGDGVQHRCACRLHPLGLPRRGARAGSTRRCPGRPARRSRRGGLLRLDPRPDGRRRRDPEGGRDAGPPAAGAICWLARDPASSRVRRPCTTTCATGIPRCCGVWRRRSPLGRGSS